MFDIGFSELVLIGIVALLVLGPERLPKVARAAGLWAGRARRFVASVKADIDRELKADELKQEMERQARSSGIHEVVDETRTTLNDTRKTLNEIRESDRPAATGADPTGPSTAATTGIAGTGTNTTGAAAPLPPRPTASHDDK